MRIIMALLAVGLLSGTAVAQESDWHVGFGYAFGKEDFDSTGGLDVDDASIINFQTGYRLNDNITLQGEWKLFDGFDLDTTVLGATPINISGDAEGWMLMFSGKYYPMAGRYRPYLIGGVGWADAEIDIDANAFGIGASLDADDSAIVWQLGLGMGFNLHEHWSMELEAVYEFPTGDLDDLNFWSFGLNAQYRF